MALPLILAARSIISSITSRAAMAVARQAAMKTAFKGVGDIMKDAARKGGKDMLKIKVSVDTRAFDAALKRYLEFTKKTIPEIVNTKAYFIARNAVNMTGAIEPNAIQQELLNNSAKYPKAPLGAILINSHRGAKGEKGLYGRRMKQELNRLVKARKRTTNFLRAGWIAAIKAIEPFVPKKSGPAYKNVKIFGSPKGGAKGARPSSTFKASAEIWNSVTGGKKKEGIESKGSPSKVAAILEAGLQKAIAKEVSSMEEYIEKKMKEGTDKLKRGR